MEQSGLNGMSAKGSVDVAYFGVFHVWGGVSYPLFLRWKSFSKKS